MPIIYPLQIPSAIGEAKANLKKFDAVAEVLSPFDGSAQQQAWADQHWELDLMWPQMTWDQFAALDAFSGALHGKLGSFLWGPPLATGPRGSGIAAKAVTTGTNANGSNLLTTGAWLPNQSGLLLPGDFLQITALDTNGVPQQRLHQYVNPNPLVTDGGGNATLDIWPCLREAPPAGTAIVLVNPAGTFRLADNRREAPADKTKTFTFELKCREAI